MIMKKICVVALMTLTMSGTSLDNKAEDIIIPSTDTIVVDSYNDIKVDSLAIKAENLNNLLNELKNQSYEK